VQVEKVFEAEHAGIRIKKTEMANRKMKGSQHKVCEELLHPFVRP
jgi:hypothetical protein